MLHQYDMGGGSKLDIVAEKRNINAQNVNKQNGGRVYLDLIFARFVAQEWLGLTMAEYMEREAAIEAVKHEWANV